MQKYWVLCIGELTSVWSDDRMGWVVIMLTTNSWEKQVI